MTRLFPSWNDNATATLPEALFEGRTVLVSGAGGSLGTALTLRLAQLPLKQLVLVDTSEYGLIRLKDRLERERPVTPSALTYVLGDVRIATDRTRCLSLAPSVVFHMAAYKHVPFLEDRPIPATQNNLLATADWLSECRAHDAVDRFVFVSTDKAVDPVGVMGATKALAERLIRGIQKSKQPELTPTVIRLCNVFGSRGSVVPRFCRRLRNGDPLPITHPEMERWFTTPDSAAQSVLQTIRHEAGTYVPARCKSIRIMQLARRLVQWADPEAEPNQWIQQVGLRPAERLHERLMAPEEKPGTEIDGDLIRARSDVSTPIKKTHADLDRLRQQCDAGATHLVRETLFDAMSRLKEKAWTPH